MALAGLRGTGDWGTDERPTNFRDTILWLNPNGQAPLTALMSKMSTQSTDDPKISWWEEKQTITRVAIGATPEFAAVSPTNTWIASTAVAQWDYLLDGNGGVVQATVGGTTDATAAPSWPTTVGVTVTDGTVTWVLLSTTGTAPATTVFDIVSGALGLLAGDTLLVEATSGIGEIVKVATDPTSDTSIIVVRGVSGTTIAEIPAGAFLTKMGNVFSEGTGAPNSIITNPTLHTNYAQIFKTAYEITKSAIKTHIRTGDPLSLEKKRKMFIHSVNLELAFLFGQPFETTGTNGKPLYFAGGLRSFISSNVTTFSGQGAGAGQWSLDNLIDSIAPVFDYDGGGSGNERLLFVGNQFASDLNKLVRDTTSTRINFAGQVKVWGMNLTRMVLPQGTLYFRTHPLMNVHPVFTKSAFVINPRGIIYRPFRDTRFEDNIQLPGDDLLKGQWLTQASMEVHFEQTFAYLGNSGG